MNGTTCEVEEREHLGAKLASSRGHLELTSYFSYDQIREDVYQRLDSAADFAAPPAGTTSSTTGPGCRT